MRAYGSGAAATNTTASTAWWSAAPKGLLRCIWAWVSQHGRGVLDRSRTRRLSVAETVSLGEKRFISIVRVDGEQMLVAGTQSQVVLLAKLEREAESQAAGQMRQQHTFADVFSRMHPESSPDTRILHQVRVEGWCV